MLSWYLPSPFEDTLKLLILAIMCNGEKGNIRVFQKSVRGGMELLYIMLAR